MRYDAIIFDLFGTIVELFTPETYERVMTDMAHILGVTPQDFVRVWSKETWPMRACGDFGTLEETLRYVCQRVGSEPGPTQLKRAAELRFAYTQSALTPRTDAIATLSYLKNSGYKLGLISDCTVEVPIIWPSTPLANFIDVPLFSCVLHIKKPDPRIYQLACERLQVQPERCLYVGDGGSNELSGAQNAGMHPVLIRAAAEDAAHSQFRYDADHWSECRISTLSEIRALL